MIPHNLMLRVALIGGLTVIGTYVLAHAWRLYDLAKQRRRAERRGGLADDFLTPARRAER